MAFDLETIVGYCVDCNANILFPAEQTPRLPDHFICPNCGNPFVYLLPPGVQTFEDQLNLFWLNIIDRSDTKLGLVELMKRQWEEPEYRKKMTSILRQSAKTRWEDPVYIKNRSKELSEQMLVWWSEHPEKRIAMSERKTYPKIRFSEPLGHYIRSKWEEDVATYLHMSNIPYDYAPDHFKVAYDTTYHIYTPDFRLSPTLYLEVKGHLPTSEKLTKFLTQNPEITLLLLVSTRSITKHPELSSHQNIVIIPHTKSWQTSLSNAIKENL